MPSLVLRVVCLVMRLIRGKRKSIIGLWGCRVDAPCLRIVMRMGGYTMRLIHGV